MKKSELVNRIAELSNLTKKDATAALDAFIKTVQEELANGEKVQLVGFGTFEVRQRKARQGRNPRDPKQTIEIPESIAPVFKAGKSFKEEVNSHKKNAKKATPKKKK